jgi:hypothetical protein
VQYALVALPGDRAESVWRQTLLLRAVALVGVVGYPMVIIGVLAGQLASDHGDPLPIMALLLFLPFPAAFWLLILRPWIAADAIGLTIRNPVAKWRFEWEQIVGCVPGYWGVTITTVNGQVVTAMAVQKNNYATWLQLRTRADELCEFIMERARWARGEAATP